MAKAAYALFMEYGYEKTTMRMIFDRAKCGAGSAYNAFDGKDDILLEIVMMSIDSSIDLIEKIMENRTDFRVAILYPVCATLYASSLNARYAGLFLKAGLNWRILNAMADIEAEWMYPYMDLIGVKVQKEDLKNTLMCSSAVTMVYISKYLVEGEKDLTEGMFASMKVFCSLLNLNTDGLEGLTPEMIEVCSIVPMEDFFKTLLEP